MPFLRDNVFPFIARRLSARYEGRPYREFYAELMRRKAAVDPRWAVGGLWEEIGRLQFDYLVAHGLLPTHRLLDIGCGSLRGGLHFIRYLEPGHYVGLDISQPILDAGRRFVDEAGLAARSPTLLVVRDFRFGELDSLRFDFLLAQSVFTHMPASEIDECLAHVGRVMQDDASFFATFLESNSGEPSQSWNRTYFNYPYATFVDLAAAHSLEVTRMEDWKHPRRQKLLRFTRAAAAG
jgi:ubiquinone/menaquinone biosynthesis C-methylase UbiE